MQNSVKNRSEEKKKEISEKLSNIGKQRYKLLSNKQKEEIKEFLAEQNKIYWDNISEEDLEKRREMIAKNRKWDKLTDEEKRLESIRLKQIRNDYENSLSIEDKIQRIVDKRNYWNSLSDEQKYLHAQKSFSDLNKKDYKSKFQQRFEDTFNSSILVNNYYFELEVRMINNDDEHYWDYGIYNKETNELVMLIDLDGAYFHADNNYEYDGKHSKDYLDASRFQSIPNNIKYGIIYELDFDRSFELFIKILIEFTYEEFIQYQFNFCRLIGFPYSKYNDKDLFIFYFRLLNYIPKSKIILDDKRTEKFIYHFHESIYHEMDYKSILSPYKAWLDNNILMNLISSKLLYINKYNINKILQGFNIINNYKKIETMSVINSKIIINKYLNKYDVIFNPFHNFSEIMCACISMNKKYIGYDININHINEANDIINFLSNYFPEIKNLIELYNENVLSYNKIFDCLFTYIFNTSEYIDELIEICLNNFKCNKYVFVVDNTIKYQNNIVEKLLSVSEFGARSKYIVIIEN